MATLTAVAPARTANQIAGVAAAAGGDEFANDGKQLLLIENGSGAEIDLTITTEKTVDGEDVADKVIAIPDGERHLIGPFPTQIYNDGDGHVNIGYEDHTNVTVAVIDASSV